MTFDESKVEMKLVLGLHRKLGTHSTEEMAYEIVSFLHSKKMLDQGFTLRDLRETIYKGMMVKDVMVPTMEALIQNGTVELQNKETARMKKVYKIKKHQWM